MDISCQDSTKSVTGNHHRVTSTSRSSAAEDDIAGVPEQIESKLSRGITFLPYSHLSHDSKEAPNPHRVEHSEFLTTDRNVSTLERSVTVDLARENRLRAFNQRSFPESRRPSGSYVTDPMRVDYGPTAVETESSAEPTIWKPLLNFAMNPFGVAALPGLNYHQYSEEVLK